MKFEVSTVGYWYQYEEKQKLELLGFKFKPTEPEYRFWGEWQKEDPYEVEIEINTLEELLLFIKTYGEIIFNDNSILIYDNYIE
jgi:hypothetical protein